MCELRWCFADNDQREGGVHGWCVHKQLGRVRHAPRHKHSTLRQVRGKQITVLFFNQLNDLVGWSFTLGYILIEGNELNPQRSP